MMITSATSHTPAGAALTELILDVFRLNGRLIAAGDRLVADIRLTSARWQVLGAIALAETPLPVAHLARNMALTRQAVQRIVDELAEDGVVEFAPNPHHRRAKLLLLTDHGLRLYRAAVQRQVPWVNGLAAALREPDITATRHLVRTVLERLDPHSAGVGTTSDHTEPERSPAS